MEGVAVRDLAVDATDGEIHARQPPGGVVRLLAIDRDVGPGLAAIAVTVGVRTDELHRLHEHARGATAGIVHPAVVGLEHLDQELNHAARCVELAALLALSTGELRQEVLVDPAEHVLGATRVVADGDVTNLVDKLAESDLSRPGRA